MGKTSATKTALALAKAKTAGGKKGALTKAALPAANVTLGQLACPFRNLMKYRMSDDCKKALILGDP